jgi:hypothetical protein
LAKAAVSRIAHGKAHRIVFQDDTLGQLMTACVCERQHPALRARQKTL